jgi:hypothetical protein
MALYEMRTYTLYVGKMAEAQKLYTDKNLVGYFVADGDDQSARAHLEIQE